MPNHTRTLSLVPAELLPASARHELLLHLPVRGDRWGRAGNSSCRRVNDGNGIAGPLSLWLVEFGVRRVAVLEAGRGVWIRSRR
jgi:hypothetical protein